MLPEMENNIREIQKLIARADGEGKFEYEEPRYSSSYNYYNYTKCQVGSSWANDVYSFEIVFMNHAGEKDYYYVDGAVSEEEAVGVFLMEYPTHCFADVIQIYYV